MKRLAIGFLMFVALAPIFGLFGCGGGGGTSTQPPPTISVTVSPASTTLTAGTTQQFAAVVSGTSSTAVSWTLSGCTGSACGAINSSGLYTAPAMILTSISVTVTAALQSDTSKAGTAVVTQKPLSVDIPESSVDLHQGETHQFTANVTGHTNIAVTWTLSGCSGATCGTIDANGMYTAPASVIAACSVTVTATSQADTSKSDTATVHLMPPPISVSISPPTPTVPANQTQIFTATLQNDLTNAGVTWSLGASCSSATCGTLSNATAATVTYTAPPAVPNPATVTLTATSVADTSKTGTATITVGAASPLQAGYYAFVYSGWQITWLQDWFGNLYPSPSREAIAGRFYIDGAGNITQGIEDVNGSSGASLAVPFNGTYTVAADHTGSLTIKTTSETAEYQMTIDVSAKKASFIRYDSAVTNFPQNGAGYFELQDTGAFTLSGSYALGINDAGESVVGRFDIDSAGAVSQGKADAIDHYSGYENLSLTGSFATPSPTTGRGTATFTLTPAPGANSGSLSAVYYIVSASKILLIQTDNAGIGEIEKQTGTYSTALVNAPVILQLSGGNGNDKQSAVAGLISPNGSGSIGGVIDQNMQSSVILDQSSTGTYSVDSSGRVLMTLQVGAATDYLVAYLFGQNQAFVIQTTGSDALYGSFKPQTGGPFTAASIGGVFRNSTLMPVLPWSENDAGLFTFGGSGNLTLVSDYDYWPGGVQDTLGQNNTNGTYTLAANGRGMLSINLNGSQWPVACWAISPDELICIDTVSTQDTLPILMNLDREPGGATAGQRSAGSQAYVKPVSAPQRPH